MTRSQYQLVLCNGSHDAWFVMRCLLDALQSLSKTHTETTTTASVTTEAAEEAETAQAAPTAAAAAA